MREFHTREIEGVTYTAQALPARKGMKLVTKLATTLGSEVLSAIFASDEKDIAKRMAAANFNHMFYSIQAAGDDFVEQVMDTLFEFVWVMDTEKKPAERSQKNCAAGFDDYFSDVGGLKRALAVFVWVGEINFKHFLGASQ